MNKTSAYLELTKPRIVFMVIVTAALGYYLAVIQQENFPGWISFCITMLGTALASGGASVLNQYIERDVDALMQRTRNRPLPKGIISSRAALFFGVALTLGGCFLLLFMTNLLASFLTLQSAFLYVLVYTPMKRITWLNTSVGAIPGAMPPLIGWAAAAGELGVGAWILFAVLFIWQHPHFFAIAWMYREDYERGGLKMLSVVKPDGRNMFAQIIFFSILLIPISVLPTILGLSGWLYFTGAILIGLVMLASGIVLTRTRSRESARLVLRASLIYLPVLLLLIYADAKLL